MKIAKICVIGSSNYDLITYTDRLPQKGETILGYDFKMGCGGKGANQAVAAAKLGADVTMITKLGDDVFGHQTLDNYKNLNINTQYIKVTKDAPSGVAPIWVDKSGMNSIIVVPGANNLMSIEELNSASSAIESASILLCQNEIPFSITEQALKIAKNANVMTIFNPAPAPQSSIPEDFFKLIDIICPNETETEILTGCKVQTIDDAINAGKLLLTKGVKQVIITLGEKGCVFADASHTFHLKTQKVHAIDTSGAGDCFIGSFAFFYAQTLNIKDSIKRAQHVAACSVQKYGTQSSYPNPEALPKNLLNYDLAFA